MAKRSVLDHPKFTELQDALGQPKGMVIGWLECLWHFTAKFTPQGNIGKYTDKQIERWLEWNGNEGDLIMALTKCGWIDQSDDHRLLVHDWHDHCDDATKKSLARSRLQFITSESRALEPLTGKIYAIKTVSSNMVKIGFTECSVESRLEALQTGCPEKLEMMAHKQGSRKDEIALHEKYKHLRKSGEWFALSDELSAEIRRWPTMADFGVPPEPVPVPEPSLARAGAGAASPADRPPVSSGTIADLVREVAARAAEAYQARRYKTPNPAAAYYPVLLQEAVDVFGSQPDCQAALDVFLDMCSNPTLPEDAPFSAIAIACGLKRKKAKYQPPKSTIKDYTAERLAREAAERLAGQMAVG